MFVVKLYILRWGVVLLDDHASEGSHLLVKRLCIISAVSAKEEISGKRQNEVGSQTEAIASEQGGGKLEIGGKRSQIGRGRVSNNTTTSEEEGLISDFNNWRGEKGDCSRPVDQKKLEKDDGLDPGELSLRLQNINFSQSQFLDRPFQEFLEEVERGIRKAATQDHHGLLISRTQSLDGPIKDYLENLEQAFIRAKFRSSLSYKGERVQTAAIHKTPTEDSSSIKSVSVVKETKEISDSNSSKDVLEDDLQGEDNSFRSISATREAGEAETNPLISKPRRKKTNKSGIKEGEIVGKEVGNEDDEVMLVLDIGTKLGIDFRGKEVEVADFIRRREREDAVGRGRNGEQ
ncbi:hypothetical protein Q3G72_001642 [Acer saccharum]|nr:hypothetical protein Q3G72_001642 [Acer saccharum]